MICKLAFNLLSFVSLSMLLFGLFMFRVLLLLYFFSFNSSYYCYFIHSYQTWIRIFTHFPRLTTLFHSHTQTRSFSSFSSICTHHHLFCSLYPIHAFSSSLSQTHSLFPSLISFTLFTSIIHSSFLSHTHTHTHTHIIPITSTVCAEFVSAPRQRGMDAAPRPHRTTPWGSDGVVMDGVDGWMDGVVMDEWIEVDEWVMWWSGWEWMDKCKSW